MRVLMFFFGCSVHGIVEMGPLDVIVRCRRHVFHRGPHRYTTPEGE